MATNWSLLAWWKRWVISREPQDSNKGEEFLDQLNQYNFLKKDYFQRSELVNLSLLK
jgi:hypothetical protein